MRTTLLVSTLSLASLLLAPAYAADPLTGRPLKEDSEYQHHSQFLISLGMQNGGDELIGLYDNNTGEQVDSSRAGGYTRLVLGGDIAIADTAFAVEINAGVLRDGLTSNINRDKSVFRRKVLELIPFWNFNRQRVGIGAVAHLEPVWSVNLDGGGGGSVDFDDAVGGVIQYDIRYDQNVSVGARYTFITYKADVGSDTLEYSGRAFGLHATYSF